MTHPAIDARATAGEITSQTARRGVNPLKALREFGQSIWLDDLRRSLLTSGEFSRLVAEDGLRGVTSNPSIFEKAITGSADCATAILQIEQRAQLAPMALYETVAIRDIREAADLLRPVYNASTRGDGYVSLEVSPYVAHDTAATIEESRRLWKAVDRDNVMIKVPASTEGVPAIRQLISEGINVNITLLFGVHRYDEVARAYLEGLSAFVQNGGHPAQVSSVASFFVSRVDTMVDEMITKVLATVTHPNTRASLMSLQGKVGIANAKLAYQHYLRVGRSRAWQSLALKGAHPQRLLWASTTTKNPRYRDVRYVEELIGQDTINTMTPATLESFRDHGQARAASLETAIDDAHQVIETLERMGISLRKVTDRLLEDGITRFRKSFDTLLAAVAQRGRRDYESIGG